MQNSRICLSGMNRIMLPNIFMFRKCIIGHRLFTVESFTPKSFAPKSFTPKSPSVFMNPIDLPDIRHIGMNIVKMIVITKTNTPVRISALLYFRSTVTGKILFNDDRYGEIGKIAIQNIANRSDNDRIGAVINDELINEINNTISRFGVECYRVRIGNVEFVVPQSGDYDINHMFAQFKKEMKITSIAAKVLVIATTVIAGLFITAVFEFKDIFPDS